MMIALIGIVIGVVIGYYIPYSFNTLYSIYLAVGILAAIDSVLGALSAIIKERFDSIVFITGFLVNFALATVLSYIGDRLGIPLYYAAIFVFGTRLFKNVAIIRRGLIEKIRKKIRK